MLDFARSQKPFTCASCTSHMVSRFTRVNVGQEFALQLSDTFFFFKVQKSTRGEGIFNNDIPT